MTPEERMDERRCRNETQRNHLVNIEDTGVSILGVMEGRDPDTPEWSYTIGFWHKYGHPEVLIIGLPSDLCSRLLNNINWAIREQGKSFADGSKSGEVLDGYICYFRQVPVGSYNDWVLGCEWFYDGKDFPVVQMLWPNTSGVYPWDKEADEYLRWDQPILTSLP